MPEKSPLTAYQGISQGRLQPYTSYGPTDGDYVYALGSELLQVHDYATGSAIDITEEVDLTAVNIVRFAFGMIQPPTMPVERVISGSPATATLRCTGIMPGCYPTVHTRLHPPYKVPANACLVVSVDGGADQTVAFSSVLLPSGYSAQAVCDTINDPLTGLVGALATVAGDTDDPIIQLASNTFGAYGSIEVKNYIGPFTDANDKFCFNQKVGSPTAFRGLDSLSAIIAPDGALTDADTGRKVEFLNCGNASNNGFNRIMAVLPDGVTAILQKAIVDEDAGFTARLVGPLWLASVWIDSALCWQSEFFRGCGIKTEDLAINVSKLTGNHNLKFRLELPFGRVVLDDSTEATDTVAAVKS